MRTLNDPVGWDEPDDDEEWTPASGLRRATRHGLLLTLLLALVLAPVAAAAPYMLLMIWLRAPLAFGLSWLLTQLVQRSAGMVGWHCSLLAVVLAGTVLALNHVVFAIFGVPYTPEMDPWWVFPAMGATVGLWGILAGKGLLRRTAATVGCLLTARAVVYWAGWSIWMLR